MFAREKLILGWFAAGFLLGLAAGLGLAVYWLRPFLPA